MADDLGKKRIKGVETLVDDISLLTALGRSANELVLRVEVVRRRSGGAEENVGVSVRREDHVQKLRQVLIVSALILRLEDVEQAASLKAVAKLLNRLGANAVDVQEVVLSLTDEVAHGLDANLAELVGPTLRHAEVVEEVELGILAGEGAAVL